MKRFFSGLAGLFMLTAIMAASIAPAAEARHLDRPVALRSFVSLGLVRASRLFDKGMFPNHQSLVAFIRGKDLDDKTLTVRKNSGVFTVHTDNAVMVRVLADKAEVIGMEDLALNEKAYFVVKKATGQNRRDLDAVLIVQASGRAMVRDVPHVRFSTASMSGPESRNSVTIPVRLS